MLVMTEKKHIKQQNSRTLNTLDHNLLMFLLQPSCSVCGDDSLLCYHNSFTPQTVQLNITTFIRETVLFFYRTLLQVSIIIRQKHRKEGRTNVEKRHDTVMVNKKYKNQ
jgi:hypothetical protein